MKKRNQVNPQEIPDSWKRKHGFQLPLHPQQIIGWTLLFAAAFFIHTIQIPSLPYKFHVPLQVVTALVLTILFCSMLSTSLITVEDFGSTSLEDNAVQCQWCHVILTSSQTKHCSLCNKCVLGFDHHCKWLNQCIGRRNYFHFVVSISSACILCIAICMLSVMEISLIHICRDSDNCVKPRFLKVPIDSALFTFLSGIYFLLSALGSGLLIHLCAFHAYIKWNGWTTYEYIRRQLDKERNSLPPTYLINKTHKRWWSQCPCFACYTACRNKTLHGQTYPASSVFAISNGLTGGVSSVLLHHALSSMVYIHPSLPPTATVANDQKISSPKSTLSNKFWKPNPKVPRIIRTSPSVEASSEWWTNFNSEPPNTVEHLLPPL